MTDSTRSEILRLGVILLGFAMLAWTASALRTGKTTGYYRSHVYTRETDPVAFFAWVVLRGSFGLAAVLLGLLLPH